MARDIAALSEQKLGLQLPPSPPLDVANSSAGLRRFGSASARPRQPPQSASTAFSPKASLLTVSNTLLFAAGLTRRLPDRPGSHTMVLRALARIYGIAMVIKVPEFAFQRRTRVGARQNKACTATVRLIPHLVPTSHYV